MSGPSLEVYVPVIHKLVQTLLSLLAGQRVLGVHHLLGKQIISFISYKLFSYLFHGAPLALVSQDLVNNNSTQLIHHLPDFANHGHIPPTAFNSPT